jgi:hypothetical protein
MNEYDEFEAEMLEAGWRLERIEGAWQQHLKGCEDLLEYSVVYHDADSLYSPPIHERD